MRSIRAGTLAGIPILINPSWFFLFGLTTWLLATGYFPDTLPHGGTALNFLMAAVSVVAFFVSIVLHELAHTRHLNHSARFWAEVARICPGHDAAERWLKSRGEELLA